VIQVGRCILNANQAYYHYANVSDINGVNKLVYFVLTATFLLRSNRHCSRTWVEWLTFSDLALHAVRRKGWLTVRAFCREGRSALPASPHSRLLKPPYIPVWMVQWKVLDWQGWGKKISPPPRLKAKIKQTCAIMGQGDEFQRNKVAYTAELQSLNNTMKASAIRPALTLSVLHMK
jgi:hypothetical protein